MCSDYDLCSGPHVGEAAPSTLQKPSDGLQRALTLKGSITSVLMEKISDRVRNSEFSGK